MTGLYNNRYQHPMRPFAEVASSSPFKQNWLAIQLRIETISKNAP